MGDIQTFVETFDEVLDGKVSEAGRVASDAILMGDVYYRSWDRTMMIMQIIPVFSFLDVQDAFDATNAIEPVVYDWLEIMVLEQGSRVSYPCPEMK